MRVSFNMKLLQRIKNLFLPESEISDGFHTFGELYHYRMLYNAAFFNSLEGKYEVHKSYRHADGELCFGGHSDWGDINPATKQVEGNYGEKYKGSVSEKESMITPENGFVLIETLEPGVSPLSVIDARDKVYEMEQYSKDNDRRRISQEA